MLTPASLGGKKLGEPKAFMKQCSVDGIKKKIPDGFPDADKIVESVNNFVQTILNAASGAGGLDPKKLVSSVGSINTSINTLLDDVKKLSSNKCIVNEPYEPPADEVGNGEEDSDSNAADEKSAVSFGIRLGSNFSSIYAEFRYMDHNFGGSYSGIIGMQLGILLDIAASEIFHIQPGLMYIQRGAEERIRHGNYHYSNRGKVNAHYIQIPVLLSLKFSAFRLGAGPYYGICLWTSDKEISSSDFGISSSLGFDLGKFFYIGLFSDHGLTDMSDIKDLYFYNRTLGFNIGINL